MVCLPEDNTTASVLLGAVLLLSVLPGCSSLLGGSGKDDYNIDQGEIATFALPGIRTVTHSPDSLVHLQLKPKKGRIEFALDESYRDLLVEWTSGQQGGRRFDYFRTHATLWSKELSIASLMPERGVETLSEDLARDMIEERTAEYDSFLQIDVYIFAPSLRYLDLSDLQLDTAGKRVYLRDEEGRQYDPKRIDSRAPLEAFRAGRRSLYGRNTLFFERYDEDGRDLLDAERLRLHVRPSGYYFTWRFPTNSEEDVATTERR